MSRTPPPTLLRIGDLARATGASVRSIRHYDRHGLLASTRAENGYRAFPAVAVTQVGQIRNLIAAGFSLKEIGSFPDCMLLREGATACASVADARRERLAMLGRQMDVLAERRRRLQAMSIEGAEPDRDVEQHVDRLP